MCQNVWRNKGPGPTGRISDSVRLGWAWKTHVTLALPGSEPPGCMYPLSKAFRTYLPNRILKTPLCSKISYGLNFRGGEVSMSNRRGLCMCVYIMNGRHSGGKETSDIVWWVLMWWVLDLSRMKLFIVNMEMMFTCQDQQNWNLKPKLKLCLKPIWELIIRGRLRAGEEAWHLRGYCVYGRHIGLLSLIIRYLCEALYCLQSTFMCIF